MLEQIEKELKSYSNPKKEEAEDAISLAKACFEPLLNAVKSIVEKSQHQRRLY